MARTQFKDRHHAPRTYNGMRILVRRINDVFEANGCYREDDLVNKVLTIGKKDLPLGESWAERERVTGMVKALTESES